MNLKANAKKKKKKKKRNWFGKYLSGTVKRANLLAYNNLKF